MSPHAVVVQLSDPHVGAAWRPGDSPRALTAAVDAVREADLEPDAILVTGDLADHAGDAEYDLVRASLERLAAPVCVLPGSHDGRGALRRCFDVPAARTSRCSMPAGSAACASSSPTRRARARTANELDGDRLAWLEAALTAGRETPTLLAMHHPPITAGVPVWDEMGLAPADRCALAAVVARHPQVRRLAAGRLHLTIAADLAGRPVLVAPSTCVQGRSDLSAKALVLTGEPAGFVVHAVLDGRVQSYVRLAP